MKEEPEEHHLISAAKEDRLPMRVLKANDHPRPYNEIKSSLYWEDFFYLEGTRMIGMGHGGRNRWIAIFHREGSSRDGHTLFRASHLPVKISLDQQGELTGIG